MDTDEPRRLEWAVSLHGEIMWLYQSERQARDEWGRFPKDRGLHCRPVGAWETVAGHPLAER